MIKKSFFLFIVAFFFFLSPLIVNAEEFYSGSYITYYQDSNLQTQHLGAYGVYFVNGTSYVTSTANFRDTWFYTTHLDTTNIQGGSIYIPYTIGHSVLENANINTTHYSDISATCTEWTCTSSQGGSCIEYSCTNHPEGYDPSDTTVITTQYDANISLIIRCYYNGATTFVPGRIEGSNIVCPVQQNATFLYGIRIFHRLITIDTETYQLGLAAGITTYNNATSKIIEKQQETTNAVNDVNDTMNNSSTDSADSSASSWFSSFDVGSTGSITSIVSAPLRLINSITSTCQPIILSFNWGLFNPNVPDKTITIPCGTTLFWENSNLGSKVSNFRNIWNLMLGGPVIYGLLVALVNVINNALNPINDELVTLSFNSDTQRTGRDMKAMEIHDRASTAHERGAIADKWVKNVRRYNLK